MRHQTELPSQYELRRRGTSQGGLTPGIIITALTISGVLVLLAVTFVADWLRTPDLTLSAAPLLISPNGDQDHDALTATYTLSEDADVTVQVFNEMGGLVRTLATGQSKTAGQYFIVWDGRDDLGQPVADGRYRLQVTAKGAIRSASQGVALQIDTQPPTLHLVNLPDGLRVREPSLTVQGLTDPDATIWVTGNPQPIVVDGQGRFIFQRKLSEGVNPLEVRAVDPAGNSAGLTREIALVTTPPDVVITTPLEDEWTNQALTTVTGHVPPGITLTINDQPVALNPEGDFQYEWLLEEGDNLIRIVATDDVGNVTTHERLVHLKTKPPLLVLNMEEGATFGDSLLQLTGRSDAGTTVTVNGQVVPVSALGDFQATLNLFQGDNLIQAVARDQAGNVSTLNRHVRYAVSPPARGVERLARNLPYMPSLAVPLLIALPIILVLAFYHLRPVSLVLSVDRRAFTPGVPGEGKALILSLNLSKPARTTLEVLDQYGHPLATIMHNRRRSAGEHLFFWDGYDDYGRPVSPGEYVIQAVAGTPAANVTSAVQVTIQEDALVHGRVAGRRVGNGGEIIDGREDFIRRRPNRR
jgi:flagellar hook assembly protein FlgD